jgi:hypothetical protein
MSEYTVDSKILIIYGLTSREEYMKTRGPLSALKLDELVSEVTHSLGFRVIIIHDIAGVKLKYVGVEFWITLRC